MRGISPYSDRAFLGLVGPGGRRIPLLCLNSENIKVMITKLEGQIERPKMFPLRSTTSGDEVI